MLGSVLPSLKPGVSIRVNRLLSGFVPRAMALNWLGYLLAGLYRTRIEAHGYPTYPLVKFGSSDVMLSPPTLSKTSGLISPEAMFEDSSPEAPDRPEYLYPSAFWKAGPTIFSLRYWSEDA